MDANALVRELFGGGSLSLEVHSFPSHPSNREPPSQTKVVTAAAPSLNVKQRLHRRTSLYVALRALYASSAHGSAITRVCLDRLPFAMSTKIQVLSVDTRCDSLYYRTITR